MNEHPIFSRYPDLKEFVRILKIEIQNAQRPSNEIILTESDVLKILKISDRKLKYMKARREIPYSQPIPRSKCYYLLSDILEWLDKSRVESIDNSFKIKI